jgi:hypothetical protein
LPVLTAELNLAIDSPVSLSTVRRSLVNYGMNSRVACKKPLLRKVNIKKRLNFAKEHVNWTTKQSEKVLFNDETKVEIFGTHRRTFVRRAPGERYNNECLVPTVKFGGGSVLCSSLLCAFRPPPGHFALFLFFPSYYLSTFLCISALLPRKPRYTSDLLQTDRYASDLLD